MRGWLPLAVLLLIPAQAEKPMPTADVPKWSVYELTLTASDGQADPYLETHLVGVFSGPNGLSIVVKGFWDGGRTFRVRFAPTVEGTWTYMTVSSDRAMDGQMGSIRCTAPREGEHGFVRGAVARTGDWTFDDGVHASTSAVQVVTLGGSAASCRGPDCEEMLSLERDRLNLPLLRLLDRTVQDWDANGTIAALLLFDPFDLSKFNDVQAHRVIDYALARYGAYTNVVWCLHAAPAAGSSETINPAHASTARPWTTIRGIVRMDDPYFGRAPSPRVLLDECAPSASTIARLARGARPAI